VVEGSVEVRPDEGKGARSSGPVSLGARNQYSSRSGEMRTLSAKEIEDALAWVDGKIVFYDVPLAEALARFAQYHGCAINVSAAVANEPIGGRYGLDDLKGFLAGLELALPRIKVQSDNLSGAVTVSSR
jgi:transmembrane sensor